MEVNDLIKKVRKIEIKAKGLSQQIFSGGYHSTFKGRGMSFSEVRDYQYGDDVRNIDWNVTARIGTPYIKVFEEERELTVNLLIDISQSQFWGSQYATKKDFMAEIAALIAFSAMANNDRVGAIFFSDKIEAYLPPKKGRSNALRIIREIIQLEPQSQYTDLNVALNYLNSIQKKRSICFLLSDFVGPLEDHTLSISTKKHDMIGLHIYDPREAEMPNVGYVQMRDSESGNIKWFNTSKSQVRDEIREAWNVLQRNTENLFRKYGGSYIQIKSGQDYTIPLIKLFKARG